MTEPSVAGLRAAAFADREISARELARAAAAGDPTTRWLAAVVYGAQGRYGRAATVLAPLARCDDPVVRSLACSTQASQRRQLGGHADGRRWDARAVRALAGVAPAAVDPDGIDAAGAWADALLGLAADTIGTIGAASVPVGRRLLGRVAGEGMLVSWRARVRHGWLTAELALVAAEPARAVEAAGRAAALAHERGAVRHALKSDIVLATALATASPGDPRAADLLAGALDTAHRFGLDSLAWPAAIVAGKSADAAKIVHRVLLQTDSAGRVSAARSPWIPARKSSAG